MAATSLIIKAESRPVVAPFGEGDVGVISPDLTVSVYILFSSRV
jgi:hypothetical protein